MQFQNSEQAAAEISAAEEALAGGRYLDAYAHAGRAEALGARSLEVSRLRQAIRASEAVDEKRAAKAPWSGFGCGLILYLCLSARQPLEWTMPVWIAMAFLVVPIVIGLVTGHLQGLSCEKRDRFRVAGLAGAGAMFFYTGFTLAILHNRIAADTGPDTWGEFAASLFVAIVYAVLAGTVAGLASALSIRRTRGAEA